MKTFTEKTKILIFKEDQAVARIEDLTRVHEKKKDNAIGGIKTYGSSSYYNFLRL